MTVIYFDRDDWKRIGESHEAFWNGTLDRPLVHMQVLCRDPGRPAPRTPVLCQSSCHDFSVSPEDIIDAWDYQLSRYVYLGDAYPYINFDCFGPGVLAAFCGAKLDNSSGRVWFFPPDGVEEIEDIHIQYQPENPWVQRIKAIYRAGIARWGDSVLMSMPDLGGIMDVIASFRGSENLLLDLYDAPEEVHRLRKETYQAWMEAYRDLASVLKDGPGYSDWDELYSRTPSYVQQSDFCYMIGTPMFDAFVLPDLKQACQDLDHTIYHLDGVGELNHLDHILTIPHLHAVQWVYGEGKPGPRHWIDVYRKIADAGKGIHLLGSFDDYLAVREQVPHGRYYLRLGRVSVGEADRILRFCGLPESGL